jgi:hypothetical protein
VFVIERARRAGDDRAHATRVQLDVALRRIFALGFPLARLAARLETRLGRP